MTFYCPYCPIYKINICMCLESAKNAIFTGQ